MKYGIDMEDKKEEMVEETLFFTKRNLFSAAFLLSSLVLLTGFVLCAETVTIDSAAINSSLKADALLCINTSEAIVRELADAGFNTVRAQDILTQEKDSYIAQELLEKTRKSDYSTIIKQCDSLSELRDLAYASRDEVFVLFRFYNETINTKIMNASYIDSILLEVQAEIDNERYEKVEQLVAKAYGEISSLRSKTTTLNLFKTKAVGFFTMIFIENWKKTFGTLLVIIIPYILFRKKIMKLSLNNQLNQLEIRKKTIKGLIKQTQRDYFEHGKLPEGSYNIRTKKFAELIRDIDRQMPLLREELARLEKNKSRRAVLSLGKYDKKKRKA